MPKSCEWLMTTCKSCKWVIRAQICPCLVKDWSDVGYVLGMTDQRRICPSLATGYSEYGLLLQMIDRSPDMPKSCKWSIKVRICPNLANDWSKSLYAQVLQMIDQSMDMPVSCEWLIGVRICQSFENDWAARVWIMQDMEALKVPWSIVNKGMAWTKAMFWISVWIKFCDVCFQ